ncbi:MAG: hypothetical protein ACI4EV_07885, partial [Lachnospiraceae bacterium]
LFGSYFGSSSTGNTSSNMTMLSDLASIRNGSYGKLLKAYYGGNKTAEKMLGSNATTAAADRINTTKMRDSASELKDAAVALTDTSKKNSLFEKKEIKAEDGTISNDYDRDAIGKAIAEFADKYNSFIEAAADSENNSVLRTTTNMVNYVKANKKLLGEVGISIGTDNKLTVDPAKLAESDINKVKTLFNGSGSLAGSIAGSATQTYNQSVSALADKSTYSQNGKYLYSGSTYNQYL